MKILVIASSKAESKAESMAEDLFNKLKKVTSLEVQLIEATKIERLASGQDIVILPEDLSANAALYPIIDYCNEYRSPGHGKIPLIIFGNHNRYGAILNFLGTHYRQNRPDVPEQEANAHFITFKNKREDFFIFAADFKKLEDIIQQLTKDKKDKEVSKDNKGNKVQTADANKLADLTAAFPQLIQSKNELDFKTVVSKAGKSAVIIGAADGKDWDANGRSDQYRHIGKAVVNLGYSVILSGGPDGSNKDSSPRGPMYFSAKGAVEADGKKSLSICYTTWIFNTLCSIENLKQLNLPINNIAFVPNEAVRKAYLIDPANLVIVLPGALGTLSELLSAIDAGKKIVICDMYISERKCYFYQAFYEVLIQLNLNDKVQLVKIDPKMQYDAIYNALKHGIDTLNSGKLSDYSGALINTFTSSQTTSPSAEEDKETQQKFCV